MLVDTSVLIRYFTGYDKKKASRVEEFIRSKKKAEILDVIFAEVYWTLRSFYKFPKEKVLICLEALVNNKSVVCNKKVLATTIKMLRDYNISFVDAYLAAYAREKKKKAVLAYDKDFGKLPGLKQIEL